MHGLSVVTRGWYDSPGETCRTNLLLDPVRHAANLRDTRTALQRIVAGGGQVHVSTTEILVTESVPTRASRSLALDEYDARFALARERLLRICTGLVGQDVAEDVVHDAYVRGRDRRRQLRDPDLFDAWIARIAINLCHNRHRAGGRLRELLPRLVRRSPADAQRDVGLRELIERLPPRERTLVVLHYGHGYRFEEIAAMAGLSAVNVRTIVFRARRRLRGHLEDDR